MFLFKKYILRKQNKIMKNSLRDENNLPNDSFLNLEVLNKSFLEQSSVTKKTNLTKKINKKIK